MVIWLILVFILVLIWVFMRSFSTSKGVQSISVPELKIELKKDKQFIDVRTSGEYKSNHIWEFKNIPLNQLSSKSDNLSKEKEVIVICQSGMRSGQASKLLKKKGFEKVTNVKGGMSAWR